MTLNDAPDFPLGGTTLITAGPRAGKTSLLIRWLEASPSPTLYLGVTPEDASPGFLLHRCLANWPGVRARFEALRAELPGASWGGALGLAIAQAHPDFCLLLDDFHLTEAVPHADEWLALLRHFPETGTLVVASRHRIPELSRPPRRAWGPEDLGWTEHPTVQDLLALPASLRRKAIVLHLLGEALPSPEGDELVRRGIAAQAPDGLHRLRPAWQEAVLPATRCRALEPRVWREAEAELEAFLQRHLGTRQESRVSEILAHIPAEIRQQSPFLLRVEGDRLVEEGRDEAAQEAYLRALGLTSDVEGEQELSVRLLGVAVRLPDPKAFAARLASLEALRPGLVPRVEAQLRYWRACDAWRRGEDLSALQEAMTSVLAIPASGDRDVLAFQLRALEALAAIHSERASFEMASAYAQRLFSLCEAHGFDRSLLSAHALRLSCWLPERPLSLDAILGVPDEAFVGAAPSALALFLIAFGAWASRIGAHPFALDLLAMASAYSAGDRLNHRMRHAGPLILDTLLRAGPLPRARACYEALRAAPSYRHLDDNLPLSWAWGLIRHGQLDEAEEVVQAAGGDPARRHLYRLWIEDLRGVAGAGAEARAFLASPEHASLVAREPEAAVHLGLREAPVSFHLSAFGDVGLTRMGHPAPRWPRKRALSLLAHLTLHPEGLPATELLERLCRDSEAQDPLAALHTHAYNLRQALGAVGAGDLLDSVRGMYRFACGKVAFCELHAFDHLYRKAQGLEEGGRMEVAALFYRMAMRLARGPLFANLPDASLEGPRRAYAERVAYARAVVDAYAPDLVTVVD